MEIKTIAVVGAGQIGSGISREQGDVVDYVELLYSTLLPVACFTPRFPTG